MKQNPRIKREAKTASAMIDIYCRHHHETRGELCPECRELNEYAMARLSKCPFQDRKTTCGKCRVHCYEPAMRERIKTVMRFAGPKMAYRHPVMAVRHVKDSRRKIPAKIRKG